MKSAFCALYLRHNLRVYETNLRRDSQRRRSVTVLIIVIHYKTGFDILLSYYSQFACFFFHPIKWKHLFPHVHDVIFHHVLSLTLNIQYVSNVHISRAKNCTSERCNLLTSHGNCLVDVFMMEEAMLLDTLLESAMHASLFW